MSMPQPACGGQRRHFWSQLSGIDFRLSGLTASAFTLRAISQVLDSFFNSLLYLFCGHDTCVEVGGTHSYRFLLSTV